MDLDCEKNPVIVADSIRQFISEGLHHEQLSLYSAFLLNQDELGLRRMGYRQVAWGYQLHLSGVLALFMQYLFGLSIGETRAVKGVAAWLEEDLPLLGNWRNHYIRKHLDLLQLTEPSSECLAELSQIRSLYQQLSYDDGPYHTEVFPYDYYSPEDVLLGRSTSTIEKNEIEPEVEELILKISQWG